MTGFDDVTHGVFPFDIYHLDSLKIKTTINNQSIFDAFVLLHGDEIGFQSGTIPFINTTTNSLFTNISGNIIKTYEQNSASDSDSIENYIFNGDFKLQPINLKVSSVKIDLKKIEFNLNHMNLFLNGSMEINDMNLLLNEKASLTLDNENSSLNLIDSNLYIKNGKINFNKGKAKINNKSIGGNDNITLSEEFLFLDQNDNKISINDLKNDDFKAKNIFYELVTYNGPQYIANNSEKGTFTKIKNIETYGVNEIKYGYSTNSIVNICVYGGENAETSTKGTTIQEGLHNYYVNEKEASKGFCIYMKNYDDLIKELNTIDKFKINGKKIIGLTNKANLFSEPHPTREGYNLCTIEPQNVNLTYEDLKNNETYICLYESI